VKRTAELGQNPER